MSRASKRLLVWAAIVGAIGGFMAFGLYADKASAGPVDLQAVGWVLLAVAVVLAGSAVLAMASAGDRELIGVEQLRAITGLVAVVAGIIAVAALTIVTVTVLRDELDTESTVAITTSALGIVSTVITAYLGIKATANSAQRVAVAAATQSEEAVLARYEAEIEQSKTKRLKQEINQREKDNDIQPDVAQKLRQAAAEGEAEAKARRIKPREPRD